MRASEKSPVALRFRLWVNGSEEGLRGRAAPGKAEGRVVFGAFHVEGLGARGRVLQQRVAGVEHGGGAVAPECAGEIGRVGEDHGGSGQEERRLRKSGVEKSQRE